MKHSVALQMRAPDAATLTMRACDLLEAELRKAGCEPSLDADAKEFYVGMPGFEHVLSTPIPGAGEITAYPELSARYDGVEGAALADLSDERLREAARAMAEKIGAVTKTPKFGKMYEPRAVEAMAQRSNGSVSLRLVRAFDVIHMRYITRFDCVFGCN